MAISQQLWNIVINLQLIQSYFIQFFIKYFFPAGRLTKHLVDQLSADYIGFYRQGSGKLDKYGSFLLSV